MKTPRIAILILAAGASIRMGQSKLLLPWKGTFLLDHSIKTALDTKAAHVFVVLGAYSEEVHKNLPARKGCDVIIHKAWAEGMGSSLAAGVHYIQKHPSPLDAVLIMVADQPLMDAAYLNSMMDKFTASNLPIAAADYGGRGGVPAIFDKAYFDQLGYLNSEFGARALLAENAHNILLLNAGNRIADIDTPEDYRKMQTKGNTN